MKTKPLLTFLRWFHASVIITVLLISCSTNSYKQTEDSLKKISKGRPLPIAYVIIPNAGCDGCITTTEDFVIRNAEKQPRLTFVFTSISSVKLLKGKIPSRILELDNVIVDSSNYFYFPDQKKQIYPIVIYMQENAISEIDHQSPESDAITKLVAKIKD